MKWFFENAVVFITGTGKTCRQHEFGLVLHLLQIDFNINYICTSLTWSTSLIQAVDISIQTNGIILGSVGVLLPKTVGR